MAKPRRERKPRCERNSLPSKGWSKWTRAMVPPCSTFSKKLQRRGPNQVGFVSSSLRKAFPHLTRHCGIYEWGARRQLPGETKIKPLNLGSTCRAKPGALGGRIHDYVRNGSHKENLMNDALRKGHEL